MKPDTILICDDNEFILKMLEFALSTRGFVIESAKSTEEIYRRIENSKPALIFLDLNLPQDGGASVVQQLRAHAETQNIPIVLFSAEEKLPQIAEELKVDAFLRKPFENEVLIDLANRFVHTDR